MWLLTCLGTATAQREDFVVNTHKEMAMCSWRESLERCVYQDKEDKGQTRNCNLEKTRKEYSGTIRENLVLGRVDVTNQKSRRVMELISTVWRPSLQSFANDCPGEMTRRGYCLISHGNKVVICSTVSRRDGFLWYLQCRNRKKIPSKLGHAGHYVWQLPHPEGKAPRRGEFYIKNLESPLQTKVKGNSQGRARW